MNNTQPRLLVDGNSYLNAALLRGVDHDQGTVVTDDAGKQVQVNSAQYGVDGFFDKLLGVLEKFGAAPIDVIVVWDGRNAKNRRRQYLPDYKGGRDKHPAVSEQLNLARDAVTQQLRDMGATVAWQDGLEADDVLGYLTKVMLDRPNIVVTDDGDLNVLVDSNTSVWRLGELNRNPYGPFPHKYITLYKTLVGDKGDKIPGARGFGDAAWVDFIRIFGLDGLEEMERIIVHGEYAELKQSVPDFKPLQKILDDVQGVDNSYRCARLHIEEVNRANKPLMLRAGMVRQLAEVRETSPIGYDGFYGTKTLVTAENFVSALTRFKLAVTSSPFVALDIETSSSEMSDDWLAEVALAMEKKEDKVGIDVLGHELSGMSLTFGANTQHTIYMSVDHADTPNITIDQCREMCEQIPRGMEVAIQNRQFEFSVLYRTWGEKWRDNGWAGFVPNAVDTKVAASYVNENLPKGLKERSKLHLDYEQTTYEQVTTKTGPVKNVGTDDAPVWVSTLPAGGRRTSLFDKVVKEAVYETTYAYVPDPDTGVSKYQDVVGDLLEPAVVEKWETRQYKMRELTGREVLNYGCDDTICTAALLTFYKVVMSIEQTLRPFYDVELLPEYLTSLAFVQGIPVDLGKLRDMERADDAEYEKAWKTLRDYLMTKGWAGTQCPEFEGSIEPSDVKIAAEIVGGEEFSTRKRKLNAIAADLRAQFPDDANVEVLAMAVERNDVDALNAIVRRCFNGEPRINFGSPKQMQNLFYRVIGVTPRILNKLTDKQRDDAVLSSAFAKFRKQKAGKKVDFTSEEWDGLISKASTDDDVVKSALTLDDLGEAEQSVLRAFQRIKTIQTRRSLFYKTYKVRPHWRDGRVHPSLNQCEAATRRYSSSGPNVQQLPKKGEGVEFRQVVKAHHRDAVVVSMDFSGQELRIGAHLSGDEAMISCYVGDNLRDMHSLTAVKAAPIIWGLEIDYDTFITMLESGDEADKARAKELRGKAKTVNFGAQYGAMAPTIALQLMTDEETAQAFLDARSAAFQKIGEWSDRVAEEAREKGYALTMLGARRHLGALLFSQNSWEASKAERQAGNFWIQGSAAEMTKLAMARMWKSGVFWDGRFDAVFYAPIHDEVVFSVHKDQALELIKLVHPMMVAPYADMSIPIVSSISLGRNFGQQIECGDFVDDARIKEALAKAFDTEKEAVEA